ncbi:class I SAM-dependent methyltransferase [Arthrobacter sp. Sa2CUA1]|uniref:Class I SAM-dependent methyltransferase n=1 Tax=Arthrobacter gallicola TaxID=2762225 RepID=A0ABR8UTD4_9MICC|nr:class I SAM-dependent methyltransferase [Arthrobacter gallicola]MBD7995830.1 class I SAM-dependent methyltransferase [Arthrobacter gallicola]
MHDHPAAPPPDQFWDGFYRERDQVWSGNPNALLVREAAALHPGRALDLGCGEGADAVWLARQGWRVTGVDISAVALERAAAHAVQAGVDDLVTWVRADLADWALSDPDTDPGYDLVCAQFLHSPAELPRDAILHRAMAAVAPRGRLLVVGHQDFPPWSSHPAPEPALPTAAELAAALKLEEQGWVLETAEPVPRTVKGPEGQQVVLNDNVLRARRGV